MTKCFYCNGTLKKGKGVMFVDTKGKIYYFCSSKCRKNHNLKRKRRKWAKED
ncbi:MAG: 50S ribosomal protein L24e [Candidatus Aenigmarchaeota archaeon ex4484_56]|nr:MAG: 50S ribosomal protein L24e [Candidatus Aenigmarchaeota archaeon ex4484_56]